MFVNKVKAMLAAGRPVLNGWLSVGSPLVAEIMGRQGYDSVTVDMQHGALDYADMLAMLQAMQHGGVTPMVRVPWREPGITMKALDAGAQGIICPMVNTAQDAAEFVSYLRYPPLGQRSYGPTRAGFAYGPYGLDANGQVLGFAMIETKQGVENLEAIARTPGLDGLYIGPIDLTLATQEGRLAPAFDREEPEMIAIIQRILAVAKQNGIYACLHCGSEAYAARAIGWGFNLTTVSGDARLLADAAAGSVRKWRELTGAGA